MLQHVLSLFMIIIIFFLKFIRTDPDYLEFLKLIAKPQEHLPSAEIQLERKESEQVG